MVRWPNSKRRATRAWRNVNQVQKGPHLRYMCSGLLVDNDDDDDDEAAPETHGKTS